MIWQHDSATRIKGLNIDFHWTFVTRTYFLQTFSNFLQTSLPVISFTPSFIAALSKKIESMRAKNSAPIRRAELPTLQDKQVAQETRILLLKKTEKNRECPSRVPQARLGVYYVPVNDYALVQHISMSSWCGIAHEKHLAQALCRTQGSVPAQTGGRYSLSF